MDPIVECQMMIRKPIEEVFNAFIDPSVTTNFWFTKSSGKLESGKTVTWEWEMYGASAEVYVIEIVEHQKIAIEWGNPLTQVDFEFIELKPNKTYVIVKHYGFTSVGSELLQQIKDNTSGFTTLLDGAKAWLEHGLQLNLVGDKYPKELNELLNK